MAPLLKSISLTNFRSIRGTISVPLDASIVLIHGQNGSGKTSLLSGIELALTGGVPSLNRSDENYLTHLVHKQADEARVSVSVETSDGSTSRELTIRHAAISGQPVFAEADSSFFSERCYLAQSSMNRLLELYQGKESKKGDSALTKFVKDLLGLDQLDALVTGLRDAANVSRLKASLSAYRVALERLPSVKVRAESLKSERETLHVQIDAAQARIEQSLNLLGITRSPNLSPIEIQSIAMDQRHRTQLQRIALLRRNLFAAKDQWQGIQMALAGSAIAEAEKASAKVTEELDPWRKLEGARINSAFQPLRGLFTDLPDPVVVGPVRAIDDALKLVVKELRRCNDLLTKDSEATSQIAKLDEQLLRAESRLQVLDEQIAGHLADADKLAQALTAILPLVSSDECPVCGRNYRDVSSESLSSHLSSRISTLVETAGRLQTFVRERSDAVRLRSEGARKRSEFMADQLDPDQRTVMSLRYADLGECEHRLIGLESAAKVGERLLRAASDASRRLSDLRSKSEQASGFRARLDEFESALGMSSIANSEETDAALARFEREIAKREAEHTAAQDTSAQLLIDSQDRSKQLVRKRELDASILALDTEHSMLTKELQAFKGKVKHVRELSRITKIVRSKIVRTVFNDSLNALWRDLFIRLAPNESFVPAFTLPEREDGAVEAELETNYRAGGKGGNPRAMLSAGNLNTAALTLFLALHLSVEARFPCLIIDDPVQSMDEVHIAQLAALVRTLSRQHDRQIIIAVHERPLFDYLTLELSPAFAGERLITIELGVNSEGQTLEQHQVIPFARDQAITAA